MRRRVAFDADLGSKAAVGRWGRVVAVAVVDAVLLAAAVGLDRGLSASPGTSPAIILRGNFPEVRAALAVPAA